MLQRGKSNRFKKLLKSEGDDPLHVPLPLEGRDNGSGLKDCSKSFH